MSKRDRMVKKIVRGIRRKKRRMVYGADAKVMGFLYRLFPKSSPRFFRWIMKISKQRLFEDIFTAQPWCAPLFMDGLRTVLFHAFKGLRQKTAAWQGILSCTVSVRKNCRKFWTHMQSCHCNEDGPASVFWRVQRQSVVPFFCPSDIWEKRTVPAQTQKVLCWEVSRSSKICPGRSDKKISS